MFKQLVAGSVLGLVLMSGAAQAIEGSVDVSEHNTNLNVGLGTTTPGLFLKGNWLRSDHDGSTYGAGLGYNVDFGPLRLAPTAKAIFTHPEDGKDGFAVALGGAAHYSFNSMWGLYGEYYYAPESFTDQLDSYQEAGGGLSFTPVSLLNLRVGYQYIELNNKDGRKDNVLVDGPYVGASLRF
ncbi:MAG: porin [Pantoea sp.]|uniref:YfaZ family outer membrane protein n=1 Tax=unclassified Pantoea TaxID=2630326 RepID=UPI0011FCF37C|nr:YfaZ family outer membrane protein [Pantoea sp.]RZK05595.1 MAG: porin [Pantoea sp.]